VKSQDPRQLLAQRLRALREERWPGKKINQTELARALGGANPLSVPLISSWESQTNPRIPPLSRLESYAALFATLRSFEGSEPHLLSPQEMTDEERRAMAELWQELTHLRNDALRTSAVQSSDVSRLTFVEESLSAGPWRFADGNRITIVCAGWRPQLLADLPYADVDDPDYIGMLDYSDLDALFELHGHLRAANPASLVNQRVSGKLTADDYSSHLISLGGVDWYTAASPALTQLSLPVRQVTEPNASGGRYFEVDDDATSVKYQPVIEKVSVQRAEGRGERRESVSRAAPQFKEVLREDVALFARGVSPFNRKRTVSICSGLHGRGTYGVVRALTDALFRDRNAEYLQSRFSGSEAYCILTRVPIVDGVTLTPDWTTADYKLFEWSR